MQVTIANPQKGRLETIEAELQRSDTSSTAARRWRCCLPSWPIVTNVAA